MGIIVTAGKIKFSSSFTVIWITTSCARYSWTFWSTSIIHKMKSETDENSQNTFLNRLVVLRKTEWPLIEKKELNSFFKALKDLSLSVGSSICALIVANWRSSSLTLNLSSIVSYLHWFSVSDIIASFLVLEILFFKF